MRLAPALAFTLAAMPVLADDAARSSMEAMPISLDGVVAPEAPRDEVLRFARDAFASSAVLAVDESLARATALEVHAFRFGRDRVFRAVPTIDGVVVEGADRRLVVDATGRARFERGVALDVSGSFAIAPEVAVAAAAALTRGALFTDVTVENTAWLAQRVYLARGDKIRSAWRVRIPTLRVRDALDAWIDAETGAVLKTRHVARAADGGVDDAGLPLDDAGAPPDDAGVPTDDAGVPTDDAGTVEPDAGPLPPAPTATRIFRWWPDPEGVSPLDLVPFELAGLVDAEIGGPLLGAHFETRNCCKRYVCLDGTTDCSMNDPREARCATIDDEDPIVSTLSVEIPTDFLSLPVDFEVLYAKSVFCAELPRATSRPASGNDPAGFFASPVDEPRFPNEILGLASEEDAFAELQAYALTSTFFAHVRDTLDDQTFCLRDLSMACEDDGSPVVDEAGRPTMPFRITVNALRPEINIEDIFLQLLTPGGKGQTPGNPIEVNEYARENQAVFLPALSSGPINIPPELSVIAEIFTREFDSTIYFQGDRDFAYDGSIVFHEFAHAVIHTFKPNLEQYGHDAQGGHAMPGALNEGYADYLSASFSGDPAVGQYGAAGFLGGETGLRDLSSAKKCPDDIAGDVHDDSLPFSSALFAIRASVIATLGEAEVATLDRILLESMASADDDETFDAQVERIADAIEASFGASLRATAEQAFAANGVTGCERVFPLSIVGASGAVSTQTKGRLSMPTPGQLGLTSMAPAAVQFKVEVPPSTGGFRVKWDQASLIDESFGGTPVQLSVLAFEDDAPVEWAYEGPDGDRPTPYRADGTQIVFNPSPPPSRADMADPAKPFYNVALDDVDPCEARTFHVVLLNIESATPVLTNIGVEIIPAPDAPACEVVDAGGDGDGDGDGDDTDEPPVCACDASDTDDAGAPLAALAMVALVLARVRRRR